MGDAPPAAPRGLRSAPLAARCYIAGIILAALGLLAADVARVSHEVAHAGIPSLYLGRAVGLAAFAIGFAELAARVEGFGRLLGTGGVYSDEHSVWTFTAVLVLPAQWATPTIAVIYGHYAWRRWRQDAAHAYRSVFTTGTILLAARAASLLLDPSPAERLNSAVSDALRVWAAAGVNSVAGLLLLLPGVWLATGRPPVRSVLPPRSALGTEVSTVLLGIFTAVLTVHTPAIAPTALLLNVLLHRSLLTGQLRQAADRDLKTGLLNAEAWRQRVTRLLARAARDRRPVAVLVLDLDHFKRTNDSHGHLVGDRVLTAVADALRSELRPDDELARFGGEEFVLAAADVDLAAARALAERLRSAVAGLDTGTAATATVSIGLAHSRYGADGLGDLLAAADTALYAAKDAGRNCVRVADSDTRMPVAEPPLLPRPHGVPAVSAALAD